MHEVPEQIKVRLRYSSCSMQNVAVCHQKVRYAVMDNINSIVFFLNSHHTFHYVLSKAACGLMAWMNDIIF